ncbi:hypothetical protein J4Q44_G00015550 [Coregonus suidteri]|uniref:Uncharacterized protein n=1 Tax=Coregonus suidteri TaxID=861788 RepID=A0AAN8MKX4_9TELE
MDMKVGHEGVKVDSAGAVGACLAGAESPGRGGRGVLLFPEICLMELQLLAAGSPDLEVLGHVFHSLLGVVRANPRNAALLYHQGGVKTILTAFQSILSQSDSSYEDCQTVLVELLVAMVSQRITAEELGLLIRLFLEKTPMKSKVTCPNDYSPVALTPVIMKRFERLVMAHIKTSMVFCPFFEAKLLQLLQVGWFVPVIGSRELEGMAAKGGVGFGDDQQNGGTGAKGVGMLRKGGKLSPGRREGDGGEAQGHLRTSPWHVAPLHLPLVGQNCWPHMASGFSASVWMKVAENEEGEVHTEKACAGLGVGHPVLGLVWAILCWAWCGPSCAGLACTGLGRRGKLLYWSPTWGPPRLGRG